LSRSLHIVCLDVPWPPDYGGAIDMMNRIILLKEAGINIHLHYFSYNDRGQPKILQEYCETVRVYERSTGARGFSSNLPYIVSSRMSEELLQSLSADVYPVLLEGLHCTGILPGLDTKNRKVVVRMHNEESRYYASMAGSEKSWWKKFYFSRESRQLKKYAMKLAGDCLYACISTEDVRILKTDYHLPHVKYLPAFPSWQNVRGEEGMGNLCLYHGNLSVPENEEAATWLLQNVFTRIRKPFVIAGKKPSKRLQKLAHFCQHTCLVADPSESEINDLIRKAHIHVLPCLSKSPTGTRLKLLHALFEGRHCLVNEAMVKGTGLEDTCHIASGAQAFASVIAQLYLHPFGQEEIELRERVLYTQYDNKKNILDLIQYLW
jgi:hypothetical protein